MRLFFRAISVDLGSGNRITMNLDFSGRQALRAELDRVDALDSAPVVAPVMIAPPTPQAPRLSPRVAALLATIGGPHTYDIPMGDGTALRIALPTLKGLRAYRPGRTLEQIFEGCPYNKSYQNKGDIFTDIDFFQAYELYADIVAEEEKTEAGIGQQFGLLSWAGADRFYPKARQERIYEKTGVWSTWTGTHYDGRNKSRLYGQGGFITRDDEHLQAVASFIKRHRAGEIKAANETAELEKLGGFVGRDLDGNDRWGDGGPRDYYVSRALAFGGFVDSVNP